MPSYGTAREHPNLLPMLAICLQRLGIPVLVHGMLSGERGVASAYVFRELGIMPCASLAQAQQELQKGQLAFVLSGALAPALADLLALRVRLGGGALARVLARLADPFGGAALQLVPAENAHERGVLRSLLCDVGNSALLFETRDGESVVDAQCRPGIELVQDGVPQLLFDAEVTPRCAHPLPAADDLKGTARPDAGAHRQPVCVLPLRHRLRAGSQPGQGDRRGRNRQPRRRLSVFRCRPACRGRPVFPFRIMDLPRGRHVRLRAALAIHPFR
jgi:anthranilate phosphoribosyltransferase